MLQLFRNIQFTTAITLAIYVGLLHLAALLGHLSPAAPMADASYLYEEIFGWAKEQPFWSAVGAAILVYFQAMRLNSLADSSRLMDDRSWLPGMAYALMASSLPDFQFLSPPLVAATVVIFSLSKVFNAYKEPKSTALVFDSAIWIAIGSLFYPKALLLIIPVFISIGIMRSWNGRDRIAFFAGIFAALSLAWLYHFWFDVGAIFRSQYVGTLFGLFRFDVPLDNTVLLKGGLISFLLFLFVVNSGGFFRQKSMHVQKCISVLFWVFFCSIGIVLLRPVWRWEAIVLSAAPAGIFLAMSLQNMRTLFAELLHIILFAAIIFLQYTL